MKKTKIFLGILSTLFFGLGASAQTFQPTEYAGGLVSPSGTGTDWTPMEGSSSSAVQPNSYAGLLICTANCSNPTSQTWGPWTGVSGANFSLTSNGSSGASTYTNGVLNIPQYASTDGAGTVTSFGVGTWPSWLSPTVTNSTTTPSLAVASTINPVGTSAGGTTFPTGAGTSYVPGSGFNYLTVNPSGLLSSTPFAGLCAGNSPTCLLSQNNPAPCITPPTFSSYTVGQTTLTLNSTACVPSAGVFFVSNGNETGFFLSWTGVSGSTVTGVSTSSFWGSTLVNQPGGATAYVVTQATSPATNTYPCYLQLQNFATTYGCYSGGSGGYTTAAKAIAYIPAPILNAGFTAYSPSTVEVSSNNAPYTPDLSISANQYTPGLCSTADLYLANLETGATYWDIGNANNYCAGGANPAADQFYIRNGGVNGLTLTPTTFNMNVVGGITSGGALTATSAASAFAAGTTIGGALPCLQSGTDCPSSSGGVSSITGTSAATGAVTFTGAGVSQVGNTFTFGGAGACSGCVLQAPGGTSQTIAQTGSSIFTVQRPYITTEFESTGTITNSTVNGNIGGLQSFNNNVFVGGQGYDLGNNGTSAQGWTSIKMRGDVFGCEIRGICQLWGSTYSHTGIGDTSVNYDYLDAFGGKVAASDEGVEHTVMQSHQFGWLSGAVATGGTTGSNLITTSSFSCHGYCATQSTYQFADGGYMIDVTKGGATATIASNGRDTVNNGMYENLGTGTVAVSTAWGKIVPSSCTGNGNGQYQAYTSTTCNVTLGTAPASPGNFVTGTDACLTGPFAEEVAVSAVGAPAAGVQSVTFSTRYAWDNAHGNTNAALMMQGAPCGEALVASSTFTSQPIAYPVVGAMTSTKVYYSNCIVGACNGTGEIGNILQPVPVNAGGSLSRSGNVVTMVTGYSLSHPVGSTIIVTGYTPSDLNGTFTVATNTYDSSTSKSGVLTWAQTGSNETSTANGTISLPPTGINFYPEAEIIGTNSGVAGDAQLATNSVHWTTGDAVVGTPTSEYSAVGLYVVQGQSSPMDNGEATYGVSLQDDGPVSWAAGIRMSNKGPQEGEVGIGGPAISTSGSYSSTIFDSYRPANNGAIIYVGGGEPVSSNCKPYLIFKDNGAPGGSLGYNPCSAVFTFQGYEYTGGLVAPPITSTNGPSAFSAGTTVGGVLPCLQNGTDCPAGSGSVGGGTGSVTSVAVGTWPSWLRPTVTNATTTPTIAAVASAIPNAALANSAMTVNGQTCTLGSNCTVPIAFTGVTGTANAAQLPAATGSAQGAVLLPASASNNALGAAAMLPGSVAINGNVCTLGGSCTITAAPAADVKYYQAAVCDGGTAYASGVTRYDNQQPQAGCVLPTSSTLAYLAFSVASTLPQYAEATVSTPPYWTGTSLYINFYSAAVTGSVTWEVQAACINASSVMGTPTFGAAVPITTTVSPTANGDVVTAVLSNIAAPGINGCPSTSMTPGLLTYRIYRSATDTALGSANLLGTTLVTGRSQ